MKATFYLALEVKKVLRLKNWSVTSDINPYFAAPEMMRYHLQGDVYGHPRFNDGDPVTTSRIIKISDKGDYKEAVTISGSVYELHREDVDKEAEKQFSDYYERLKLETVD